LGLVRRDWRAGTLGVETYRYLMRAADPDEPLIVAAIVTR
jgi:hypothetical protein